MGAETNAGREVSRRAWLQRAGALAAATALAIPAGLGAGGAFAQQVDGLAGSAGDPALRDGLDAWQAWPHPRPLADVGFLDPDAQPLRLSAFRGRVVLLNIWATWCLPCLKELPALDQLSGSLNGPDFQVVTLASDRGGHYQVGRMFQRLSIEHLVGYVDPAGGVHRELNIQAFPTTLLLDPQGRELGRMEGDANWASPRAIIMLQTVIAQAHGRPLPGPAPAPADQATAPGPASPSQSIRPGLPDFLVP